MLKADEQKIDLARVPAPVRQAAAKAVPGAKFNAAYQETEKGKTVYTLEGEDGQGQDVEVDISADGRVLEVATEVAMNRVPKVVLDALRAKMRGFRPAEAAAITKDGRLVWYEFEGKDAKGEEIDVLVSPDGKTVREEDDDDDD